MRRSGDLSGFSVIVNFPSLGKFTTADPFLAVQPPQRLAERETDIQLSKSRARINARNVFTWALPRPLQAAEKMYSQARFRRIGEEM